MAGIIAKVYIDRIKQNRHDMGSQPAPFLVQEKEVGLKIEQVLISDLVPYMNNAKKHDKAQIENVAESIKRYGFVQPIVVDRNMEIIIGHGHPYVTPARVPQAHENRKCVKL